MLSGTSEDTVYNRLSGSRFERLLFLLRNLLDGVVTEFDRTVLIAGRPAVQADIEPAVAERDVLLRPVVVDSVAGDDYVAVVDDRDDTVFFFIFECHNIVCIYETVNNT